MKRFKALFGLVLLMLLTSTAVAAIPKLINFQGILKDGSGNPVANGSYSVTFTIYEVPTGGTALWTETQSVSTIDGLFAILLGASNPVPDTVFKGSDRWLGIAVAPDGEMPTRQQLVSVAYAYRVNSVDSASGGTITSKVSIGPGHTNTGVNAFVVGESNTVSGDYSTVGGGRLNTASGYTATVGGGVGNIANNNYATVGGGLYNAAINGVAGTVAGGLNDTASGSGATVGGGEENTASTTYATVGGGLSNTADGFSATVGGGTENISSGIQATVGGGYYNRARGQNSVVSGGGGDIPADSNSALGDYSSIGGGHGNTASGNSATVSGGEVNLASGTNTTVGGGNGNTASNTAATVGGGFVNAAIGAGATVGGGYDNTASNFFATVGGGERDTASGLYSVVPGGFGNKASGFYSLAAGRRAKAIHAGAFVWADSGVAGGTDFASTASNQFNIRAAGGTRIYSNSSLTMGVTLAAGASAWVAVSDSTLKRNIRTLDGKEILEKVMQLPIKRWSYKAQDASIEHIGPMAQDFYPLFQVGDDEKTISTIDPPGIALAAIQGLYKMFEKQKVENEELRGELKELRELVRKLLAQDKGESTQILTSTR